MARSKRRGNKDEEPSSSGAPAILGVITILVLLVGGWILTRGDLSGYVRTISDRIGKLDSAYRSPVEAMPTATPWKVPSYVSPYLLETPAVQDTPAPELIAETTPAADITNARVKELENEVAQLRDELTRLKATPAPNDDVVQRLQAENDNLKMSVQMLRAELQMLNQQKKN